MSPYVLFDINFTGTIITALIFLISLPSWMKTRWKSQHPYKDLGLRSPRSLIFWRHIISGYLYSFYVLSLLFFSLLVTNSIAWLGGISFRLFIDTSLLFLLVGFLEELIFRGWLIGELREFFGNRWAIILQAIIFSLAHTRFDLPLISLASFWLGLFLLGLVLGFMRILDGGSLLSCIGFHGGLVANWFFLTSGLIKISSNSPSWIIGSAGMEGNPIGGLLAIVSLGFFLYFQLTAVAMARRPVSGARSASSNGEMP